MVTTQKRARLRNVLLLGCWLALYIIILIALHCPYEFLGTVAAASGAVTVAALIAVRERRRSLSTTESTRQMSARLATVSQAASLLANACSLEDLLTQLWSLALRQSGVIAGTFFLLDQATGNLYPCVPRDSCKNNLQDYHGRDGAVSEADCPVLEQCMASARPIEVDIESADLPVRATMPEGTGRLLLMPLVNQGHRYGVFGVAFDRKTQHGSIETGYLTLLAHTAGAGVALHTIRQLLRHDMAKIGLVCRTASQLGPQIPAAEARRVATEAIREALETDLVALFTIDSYLGRIDCESTPGVNEALRSAFLELHGDLLTDRERVGAVVKNEIDPRDLPNEEARKAFAEAGIHSFVACPVRSDLGVSGVLVAFYGSEIGYPEEYAGVVEVIAAVVSSVISYALAMEQSSQMLDDLAGANHRLSVQATMDGLTGLMNHRSLQQSLSEMCRPARAGKKQIFCVVMVDVDHFKIYNDTHGHCEGDVALRQVAKLASASLRPGDIAARYGGEEFALILRGVNKETAFGISDRIRQMVAEQQLSKGSLTVTMGIAEFPADGSTPAEVIERADQALYHAKITGRNRIVAWGSAGCATPGQADGDETTAGHGSRTVLVVERPDEEGAGVIEQGFSKEAYVVETAESAADAMEVLRTRSFDILLLSMAAMPDGDVKSIAPISAIHPDMPVVLILEQQPAEMSGEALRCGASDVVVKPLAPGELPVVVERNIERRRLERQRLANKSTSIMLQAIEALVAAIDAKDHYTAGHSQRVTALSLAIADQLDISSEERYALELAARIHDIGKLGLPDSALNKESHLTEDEWTAMRQHPALGSKIVGSIDELAYVSAIIRHHHERLDGTGYPDGLSGDAIPHLARIIAVADTYEAMTSQRAHRARLTPREAIEELRLHSGAYYERELVEILENHLIDCGDITRQSGEDLAA